MITIENVGDGTVISTDSLDKCPYALEREDKNIVEVSLSMSDAGEITCKPEDNKVRLTNGKGLIFCKVPIGFDTNYETPLDIHLSYGYSSSIERTVEIIKPVGEDTVYS